MSDVLKLVQQRNQRFTPGGVCKLLSHLTDMLNMAIAGLQAC